MFIAGVVLVVLGLVFFLQNTGFIPFDTWNNIWPILLILVGLVMTFSRRSGYGLRSWGRGEDERGMNWSTRDDREMGEVESRAYGHEKENGPRGKI